MSDETVSLELRSVVQRFNDSSEVLEQLRERLRLLALADETQSASARSIGEFDGLIWPRGDGLSWPHLAGEVSGC